MQLIITLFLMGCVALGGVVYSSMESGLFNKNATEPFLSQQDLQLGVTMILVSAVPFYRDNTVLGWISLALGLLGLLNGSLGIFKYSRTKSNV